MDKLDETLGKVAQALADATNKYGPDVAEYVMKTIHYDAVQYYIGVAFFMIISLVSMYIFSRCFKEVTSNEDKYTDPELIKGFHTLFWLISAGVFIGSIVCSCNVYQYQALFGDPKITLTKRIMEKL